MIEPRAVVFGDTLAGDRLYIELIALADCPLEAEQFVTVNDGRFLYFAKLTERPVNFSPTLARDDAASLSAMYKKLLGDIKLMAIEQYSLLHYRARLLQRKSLATGERSEVFSAPMLGSEAWLATAAEVVEFLELPPMIDALRIGHVFHVDIPICLSRDVIRHHLLIAGTTGQGKTTLITNIVTAANVLDTTVFLMDFKPDYQHVEEATAGRERSIARKKVSYWNLNQRKAYRAETKPIHVHFSELQGELYLRSAATSAPDSPMYDAFIQMYDHFVERMRQAGRDTWTCREFYDDIPKHPKDGAKIDEYFPAGDVPFAQTFTATNRITKAKPSWVDVTRSGRGLVASATSQTSFFEEKGFLEPGRVHVIEANIQRDKHYGLFMATLMQKVLERKESEGLKHLVLIVIDEAQDIFNGGYFGRLCEDEIAGVIRKGRSQNIGVVIAVQSADSVPHLIANNLNSTIAFRHNSEDAAGFVKKQLGPSASHLQELERGNVVMKFFGAKSVLRAVMDTEAFRLVKDE